MNPSSQLFWISSFAIACKFVFAWSSFCFDLLSSLKEDELAGRLGLQLKELSKIMAVLHADKLVKMYVLWFQLHSTEKADFHPSYRQNELKEGATRAQARQYYYIDYQHFCNVLKWRVSEMRRIIDSKLRNVNHDVKLNCHSTNKKFF